MIESIILASPFNTFIALCLVSLLLGGALTAFEKASTTFILASGGFALLAALTGQDGSFPVAEFFDFAKYLASEVAKYVMKAD